MRIKDVSIDAIRPYENNPRVNDEAVPLVANSIREFGFKQPIVVDADGTIIAGHTRYRAAVSLGMETVPALYADDLTPEQVNAYRLADNKVSEAAEWDMSKLDEELDGLLDFDMEQFGFESIFEPDEPDAETKEIELSPFSKILVMGVFDAKDADAVSEAAAVLEGMGAEVVTGGAGHGEEGR